MKHYSITIQTLFFVGRLLSPIYSALMRLRASLYAKGIFKQYKLPAFVISIGNLTLGGTGKTPMIQFVAKFLLKKSRKPAVVSRGYGGRAQDEINIISDGKTVLLDAEISGDEPRMLAETLPGVPIITGEKRYITGSYAIKHLEADSILLDDGFQHLGVARDLDLVLFNADTLLGNRWTIPGGELRESPSALQRAHGFIITGVNDMNYSQVLFFKQYLNKQFPDRPVFTGIHQTAQHLSRGVKNTVSTMTKEEVAQLSLYAFCGIANPNSFRQTLTHEHFNILGFKIFRDHHSYSSGDIKKLRLQAKRVGAQALITTEKDFVKLKHYFFSDIPILALKIELVPEKAFDLFLAEQL